MKLLEKTRKQAKLLEKVLSKSTPYGNESNDFIQEIQNSKEEFIKLGMNDLFNQLGASTSKQDKIILLRKELILKNKVLGTA